MSSFDIHTWGTATFGASTEKSLSARTGRKGINASLTFRLTGKPHRVRNSFVPTAVDDWNVGLIVFRRRTLFPKSHAVFPFGMWKTKQ